MILSTKLNKKKMPMVSISAGIVLTSLLMLTSNVLYLVEILYNHFLFQSSDTAMHQRKIESPTHKQECYGSLDLICILFLNFIKSGAFDCCGYLKGCESKYLLSNRRREDVEKMEDELHRWLGSMGIDRIIVTRNEKTKKEPNFNKYYRVDSLSKKNIGFNEKYKYESLKHFKQNVSFGSFTYSNEFSSNKLKNINYKQRSEIGKTEFDSKQYVEKKDGTLKNKNEVTDDKFDTVKKHISSKHGLNIPEDGNEIQFQKGLTREYEIEFDGFSIHIDENSERARSDQNRGRPKLKDTQEQRRIHHKEYLEVCKSFGINSVVTIHGRLYRVLIGTREFILTKDELVKHIDVIPPQDPSFKLMFSFDDTRIKSIPP